MPGKNLVPGAFRGRFNAQVQVQFTNHHGTDIVQETQLKQRIPEGPKSAEEMQKLSEKLDEDGQIVDGSLLSLLSSIGNAASTWSTERESKRRKQDSHWAPPWARGPAPATRSSLVKSEQVQSRWVRGPAPVTRSSLVKSEHVEESDTIDDTMAGLEAEAEQESEQVEESGEPSSAEDVNNKKVNVSPCWDFVRGNCPRGASCRYAHVKGTAKGYVFLCNTKTQAECGAAGLLGSPQKELPLMQEFINDDTQLFLYNFQTQMLIGTFSALTEASRNINAEAFNGKFSAQVSVVPMDQPLLAAKFLKSDKRISSGPKTEAEVDEFIAKLAEGNMASPDVQESWGIVV